jgi:hypothetical protein
LRNTPLNPSVLMARMEFAKAALPLPTFARTAQDFSFCVRVARYGPFCAIAPVCAVAPTRAARRLSTSELRQNRDLALLAAMLCPEWPAAEQRYGVRRFAQRAHRFVSRHAPGRWRDLLEMRGLALAAQAGLPMAYARAFARIAHVYGQLGYAWAKPSLPDAAAAPLRDA